MLDDILIQIMWIAVIDDDIILQDVWIVIIMNTGSNSQFDVFVLVVRFVGL